MSTSLRTQFYVENLGGAGGNIGTGHAARAAPDGYTILAVAPSYAANPALFGSLPYDPEKSFDAVTVAATAPTILTVHPSVPANSGSELIGTIRASPGKYSYASPGTGTPPHLLGELFRMSLQLDMVHVPYNGGGQAIGSTLAGHTPISFGALPPAVQHVKEGKLRALAITSTARADALADVPTIAEAGYRDFAARYLDRSARACRNSEAHRGHPSARNREACRLPRSEAAHGSFRISAGREHA